VRYGLSFPGCFFRRRSLGRTAGLATFLAWPLAPFRSARLIGRNRGFPSGGKPRVGHWLQAALPQWSRLVGAHDTEK
jgi:hypothetical protein